MPTKAKRWCLHVAIITFMATLVMVTGLMLMLQRNYTPAWFLQYTQVAYPLWLPGMAVEEAVIQSIAGDAQRVWVHPTLGIIAAAAVWAALAYAFARLISRLWMVVSWRRQSADGTSKT